jgi:hypothetical protein
MGRQELRSQLLLLRLFKQQAMRNARKCQQVLLPLLLMLLKLPMQNGEAKFAPCGGRSCGNCRCC